MGAVKKAVKKVTRPIEKVVSGAAGAVGLKPIKMPDVNIPGPSPEEIANANLQRNLSTDLGMENIPDVEIGGTVGSESDTRRKRKASAGVSSSLGII